MRRIVAGAVLGMLNPACSWTPSHDTSALPEAGAITDTSIPDNVAADSGKSDADGENGQDAANAADSPIAETGGGAADARDDAPASWSLARGGFVVSLSAAGDITGVKDADGRAWVGGPPGDNLVRVSVGPSALVVCDQPVQATNDGETVVFEYDLGPALPLRVRSSIALLDAGGGIAIERKVEVTPTSPPLTAPVGVSVGDNLTVPGSDATLFVPHHDGYGEVVPTPTVARRFSYLLSGTTLDGAAADRLAIPMVSEGASDGSRVTHVSDPYFSTSFAIGTEPAPANRVTWVYPGDVVPMNGTESRLVFDVLHRGDPTAAMEGFYATATRDLPPGPSWLHDIAWQHYDYLSHGGQGWFDDIDTLNDRLPPEDHGRVLLTVHGWFDVYGRYAFDPTTGSLVENWTAFPNAAAVAPSFPGAESVAMTKAEVHRRIAYAKSRGFRVGFYFADGTASGQDVDGLWRADRVLAQGGWQGPDTTSPTWVMNPAHPDVAAYFRSYLDALLAEYGNEVDALVWDETFTVHVGAVGPAVLPSYADRAMMQLMHDLTVRVSAFNPELALLASDDIGLPGAGDNAPYAIMSHGTYQDSWSLPGAWRYGLFPNFRNTLWSCNWHPETNFDYTRAGVELFNTPVASSNGYGDNLGIAALDPTTQQAFFDLFATRKLGGRQVLHWLDAAAP